MSGDELSVETAYLTTDERARLGCRCTRLDDEWHHVRFCPVPEVGRILTAHTRVAVAALIETGRHTSETARNALARAGERIAEYDARVSSPPAKRGEA